VNFTREPIVETIISPKEGYKLIVRNSKGGGQEEYAVDALEVVSFGHSFFFRSTERPKSFLVPVGDYEVIEAKETRVALKNVTPERGIKIAGGRDAPLRSQPQPIIEKPEELIADEEEQVVSSERPQGEPSGDRGDKKRDRSRRHRRRRGGADERQDWNGNRPKPQQFSESGQPNEASSSEEGGGAKDETQVSSSVFTSLIPPPTTLISDTIGRYKDLGISEGNLPARQVKPQVEAVPAHKEKKQEKEESSSGGEGESMSRVLTSAPLSNSTFDGFSVTTFSRF
jgi:hypothetical protein